MIYKLVHIILAGLVLISTTGIVVNKHYCQNQLKNIALFSKAKSCHDINKVSSCPLHNNHQNEDKGCCDEETDFIKSDEEFVMTSSDFVDLEQPAVLATIYILLQLELPSFDANTLHYLTYKPPIVFRDIPVLLETFLL